MIKNGHTIIFPLIYCLGGTFILGWNFKSSITNFGQDLGSDLVFVIGLIIKLAILAAIITSFILFPIESLYALVIIIAIGVFVLLLGALFSLIPSDNISRLFWWGGQCNFMVESVILG